MNKQLGYTVENELKDYRGYKILKVIDNYGLCTQTVTYMAVDGDDNVCNCSKNLKKLKKWIDKYSAMKKQILL